MIEQVLRATSLYQSPLMDRLAGQFGHKYELLTAQEKLNIVTCLAGWQSDDTKAQDEGYAPIPFAAWAVDYGLFEGDRDASAGDQFLLICAANDIGDDEAFAISIALIAQCQQQIYKRVEG